MREKFTGLFVIARHSRAPSGNSRRKPLRPIPTGWKAFLFHDIPILLIFAGVFSAVYAMLELIVYGTVR